MTQRELEKFFLPLVDGSGSNLIQRVVYRADYTMKMEKVTIKQILKALQNLSVKQERAIDKYVEDTRN